MRNFIAAALVVVSAIPAFADTTEGTVVAFDRKAEVLVMEDKTVWQLSDKTAIPDDLVAGELIRIEFTSTGDDGVASVDSLVRM